MAWGIKNISKVLGPLTVSVSLLREKKSSRTVNRHYMDVNLPHISAYEADSVFYDQ